MEAILDRALDAACRWSPFSSFSPQYRQAFRTLWVKHAGPDHLWISCDGIVQFASDMFDAGFHDWNLDAKDIRDNVEPFRKLGGMPLQVFAEYSERTDFDGRAVAASVASAPALPHRLLEDHLEWLKKGQVEDRNMFDFTSKGLTICNIRLAENQLNENGQKMVEALQRDGVFLITEGHGVQNALGRATHEEAAVFFDTVKAGHPAYLEEVRGLGPSKLNRGFLGLRDEQLNLAMGPDKKELFDFGLPDVDVEFFGMRLPPEHRFRYINRWPPFHRFREVSVQHGTQLQDAAKCVLRHVADALSIPSAVIDEQYNKSATVTRLLRYPPQGASGDSDSSAVVEIGAGSHADYGALTLLYQDAPGLQVMSHTTKEWYSVPHVPGSIIVISGYALEKTTNGLIPSTIHRVINNGATIRHSTALFLDPDPLKTIGPLLQFCTAERPARYEPCEAGRKGVEFKEKNYGGPQTA